MPQGNPGGNFIHALKSVAKDSDRLLFIREKAEREIYVYLLFVISLIVFLKEHASIKKVIDRNR